MTSIVVGCPLWKRGWVLPTWFEYTEKAFAKAGIEPIYAFVGDPRDTDSFSCVDAALDLYDRDVYLSWIEEPVDAPTDRQWNESRYHRMVYIRNELLDVVRGIHPTYFLSLDSDILLHPDALVNLIESTDRFDAVGGKTYMTPFGRQFPSYGYMPGLRRIDESAVFRVDVIMAIKLLNQQAYNVDYMFHSFGEDIGFSQACLDKGLILGWDGRVTSKHAMDQEALNRIDDRCGF